MSPTLRASIFVFGTWIALAAAAFYLVGRYGTNVPYWDEWDEVPYVTGHEEVTLARIWSAHNEHRIPVPRAIYLALLSVSGGDYRAGMYASAALLSALALGLVLVARRIRGRVAYEDAVFPLLLLHWGHGPNLLISFQIALVLSSAIAMVVYLGIVGQRGPFSVGAAGAVGAGVALLPLNGATGLVMMPPLGLWCAYAGWRARRSGEPRGRVVAAVFGVCGAVALVLGGLYIVGFEGLAAHRGLEVSTAQGFERSAEFIGMSLGRAGAAYWPWITVVVLAVAAATAALVLSVAIRRPEERLAGTGALLTLLSLLALAAAVGWGRRHLGTGGGFHPRFALLAAPLVAWAYLAWLRWAPGRGGRLVGIFLLALTVGLLPANMKQGRRAAARHQRVLRAVELDVRRGLATGEIAARHARRLHPSRELLELYLPMLERARMGPYSQVLPHPARPESREP